MICSKCKKNKAVWFPPEDKEIIKLWEQLQWEAKPLCDKCHSNLRELILKFYESIK